jgi:hypothetical protein
MQPEDKAISVIHESAGELAGWLLDDTHVGHIDRAFGIILHGDSGPRIGWRARIKTLLAILGHGLIVMVDYNDADASGTYRQGFLDGRLQCRLK